MRAYKQILKGSLLFATMVSMGMSYSVLAADTVAIYITGTVKASPCTVDASAGNVVNVDLGTNIQAASLTAAQGSDWVPVTLHLKDCPTSTTSVVATFSGTQAAEETGLYQNTGNAGNVQIELQDVATSARKGNNSTLSAPVLLATNDATFSLRARAYSANGGATPGSIVGTVQVAFTYP